jgi:hypothetical protein
MTLIFAFNVDHIDSLCISIIVGGVSFPLNQSSTYPSGQSTTAQCMAKPYTSAASLYDLMRAVGVFLDVML